MHAALVTADIPVHHTGLEAVFALGAPVVVPASAPLIVVSGLAVSTLDDAYALLGLREEPEPAPLPVVIPAPAGPAILWFDGINP